MDALLAFAAALVSLRLTGRLLQRWRERRTADLAAWSASLAAFAAASGCARLGRRGRLERAGVPRVLPLRRPAHGAAPRRGSLLRYGLRWAAPVALVYAGLAAGVAVAVPLHGSFGAEAIPEAQEHLDLFPARILAVAGNSLGTLAVVAVAVATFRRRPRGNALVLAGGRRRGAGSALSGSGSPARPRHSRSPRGSSTAASSSAASCVLVGSARASATRPRPTARRWRRPRSPRR